MKRKVITLMLMSAITCCLFSGCGKAIYTDLDKNNKVKSEAVGEKEADRKAEEKTEAKSDKKSEEKSEEKPREQSEAESEAESDYEVNYASVLDEVYKVVTAGYDYDKKYKYISDGLMEKCMYPGDKDLSEAVGYILEDISGDDIPELVLANGTAPWNPVHVFACKDGEVKETGEYSMYGKMYYTPKKGYILPMYYIPVADAEIMIYGSDKTIPFDLDRDSKSFTSPADYNSRSLADVKDMEDELARMKESAPLGISAMGAAIIDDSYLTEGVVSFDGKHAGQIPGIWYLQTEDADAPTWIEFDTNGTFTTHYNEMAGAATGYIRYEQESPILEDGGIYYLYYSYGTRYDAFEIGPDSEHGYMMNFFGRVYYRNQ